MSLVEHTKQEIELLKKDDEERYYDGMDYDDMLNESLLSIIELIASQGHSGGSLGSLIYRLNRLLNFKPLTALTGSDDEWIDVGHGMFQNKRMPSVFKENGNAYDIDNISPIDDGVIQEYIKFPYYPF